MAHRDCLLCCAIETLLLTYYQQRIRQCPCIRSVAWEIVAIPTLLADLVYRRLVRPKLTCFTQTQISLMASLLIASA